MYSQHPYRCRFDWGRHGVRQAVERGGILVIVDTISFSTSVVTAIHRGGLIYPCSMDEDVNAIAQRIGGEAAVHRRKVPEYGRFSLSPTTFLNIEPGTRVVLASPNGATCSRYAEQVPYLFVGALINAKAIAAVVSSLIKQSELSVTVIACGERWNPPTEDGPLRFAIEDYLGAGAILSYLHYAKSPEARVCEGAFLQVQHDLQALLWDCDSGQELREKGFGEDVIRASQLNIYETVPHMSDGYLKDFKYSKEGRKT